MTLSRSFAAFVLLLAANSVGAHPGHEAAGFASGFHHPLGGLDHVLAMLAVGLYAGRQPGAMRWALPGAFVAAMLGGAAIGATGVELPAVETGIAVSVLVFGVLIAFMTRPPLAVAVALVAAFALFHGYAHHAEMGDGTLASYAAGFAIVTAGLHGAGFMVARWLPQTPPAILGKRVLGALIAGTGAALLGI